MHLLLFVMVSVFFKALPIRMGTEEMPPANVYILCGAGISTTVFTACPRAALFVENESNTLLLGDHRLSM
jgi:hypothetical protein